MVMMLGSISRIACFCGIRPLLGPPVPPPPLLFHSLSMRAYTYGTRRQTTAAASLEDADEPPTTIPPITSYWQAGEGGRKHNAIVPGTVYFVATPMGNLGDITLRALDVLSGVDLIASEDTRHTGMLLQSLGLGKKKQLSHHQHNMEERVPELIRKAKEGLSIAVVTDAGTPGVSDPGSELAAACWDNGVSVVPVPGSCAAVAALSISGFLSTEFVFYGFLPRTGSSRTKKLRELVTQEEKVSIFYESPQRIVKTLEDLVAADAVMATRMVLCARELTKLHEDLYRATVAEAIVHFGGGDRPPRGEFTVVVAPAERVELSSEDVEKQVRIELMRCMEEEGMSTSEAVKRVAKAIEGVSKSTVYDIALRMKEEGGRKKKSKGKGESPPS